MEKSINVTRRENSVILSPGDQGEIAGDRILFRKAVTDRTTPKRTRGAEDPSPSLTVWEK